MSTSDSRYFQLALLWLRDREKFARYASLVAPIVRPYGAGLACQFLPTTIYAEGMDRPDVVNLVYYESQAAYHEFMRDPAFKQIVHLRSESIAMASVEGSLAGTFAAGARPEQRLYVLELARLGRGGQHGYEAYENEAEPVMTRYSYEVNGMLRPDGSSGLSFTPDVVKIASFTSAADLERMHEDPAHSRIENVLYPEAVAESVWLVANAAPRTSA
jgi:uncharacterized protein (DUF1330 family)